MAATQLNIIFWNCRGIRNKYLELYDFLNTNNVDLCFLTETWLTNSVNIPQIGYYCVRCDRPDRTGGGVAILIRKCITNFKPIFVKTEKIENVGICLKTSDAMEINLFSVYFPGGESNSQSQGIFRKDIRKLLKTDRNVIICGDLNSRHRNWMCNRANTWGNILCNTVAILPYTILHPSSPTYIPTSRNKTPSILDIVVSNVPQYITNPITINSLSSDHLPVSFNLNLSASQTEHLFFNYKKANWGFFKSSIDKSVSHLPRDINNTTNCNSIDLSVDILTNSIIEAADIAIPKIKSDLKSNSITPHIKHLIITRNYYRRQWMRYRNTSDLVSMNIYSTEIRYEISKLRNISWNNKIKDLDKASKPFWNIAKCLRKKKIFVPPLLDKTTTHYSDEEKVNQLAFNFLKNHRVSEDLGDETHVSMVDSVNQQLSSFTIATDPGDFVNTNEIRSIIKELKPRKAAGIDGVKNLMLKQLPNSAILYFCFIINCCLKLQYFPKIWKTAKVIPIIKPNKPPNSVSSYRPISLLSSLSKILEKVLKSRISKFMDQRSILPLNQFGFRPFHSTTHQIKRLYNHINTGFKSGSSTIMVTLDIEKAFDSVWYNGLLYKMVQFNFPLYLIRIVESFLKNRLFCVCLNDKYSDLLEIPAGVPQGSVLGPILYILYCSDMPDLNGCNCATYADDTCLFFSHEFGQNIVIKLQCALENLVSYFEKWKIKINEEKTQAVFFTRKRKACFYPTTQLKINGTSIPWNDSVKYLGVHMDRKLIFELHVKRQIEKFNMARNMLYPLIRRGSPLSSENKIILAKVVFQSIILYACPVWGVCAASHVKKLQICQNKLLKMMLSLPWHFSTRVLHNNNNIRLIRDRINTVTERFKIFCGLSENPLISSLYD